MLENSSSLYLLCCFALNQTLVAPQFIDEIYQDRRQSGKAQQICYISNGGGNDK